MCLLASSDSTICQRHPYPSSLAEQKARKIGRLQSSLKVSLSMSPLLQFEKLNFFQIIANAQAVERTIAEIPCVLYLLSPNGNILKNYVVIDICNDTIHWPYVDFLNLLISLHVHACMCVCICAHVDGLVCIFLYTFSICVSSCIHHQIWETIPSPQKAFMLFFCNHIHFLLIPSHIYSFPNPRNH